MRKQTAKPESSFLCPLFEVLEPRTLLSASAPVIGDLGSLPGGRGGDA